jgi:hypothetical protein
MRACLLVLCVAMAVLALTTAATEPKPPTHTIARCTREAQACAAACASSRSNEVHTLLACTGGCDAAQVRCDAHAATAENVYNIRKAHATSLRGAPAKKVIVKAA